jgi:hypothetical protein
MTETTEVVIVDGPHKGELHPIDRGWRNFQLPLPPPVQWKPTGPAERTEYITYSVHRIYHDKLPKGTLVAWPINSTGMCARAFDFAMSRALGRAKAEN